MRTPDSYFHTFLAASCKQASYICKICPFDEHQSVHERVASPEREREEERVLQENKPNFLDIHGGSFTFQDRAVHGYQNLPSV
jgi:hypothetical protein